MSDSRRPSHVSEIQLPLCASRGPPRRPGGVLIGEKFLGREVDAIRSAVVTRALTGMNDVGAGILKYALTGLADFP